MYFSYLLEKIKAADILISPFQHVQINDFFQPDDFEKIVKSKDIQLAAVKNDHELFEQLFDASYKLIEFPGCTINQHEYIKWHRHKAVSTKINTANNSANSSEKNSEKITASSKTQGTQP